MSERLTITDFTQAISSHLLGYNDGCIPTASAADWAAYAERLEALAKIKIVP